MALEKKYKKVNRACLDALAKPLQFSCPVDSLTRNSKKLHIVHNAEYTSLLYSVHISLECSEL